MSNTSFLAKNTSRSVPRQQLNTWHPWFFLRRYRQVFSSFSENASGLRYWIFLSVVFGVPFFVVPVVAGLFAAALEISVYSTDDESDGLGFFFMVIAGVYWTLLFLAYKSVEYRACMPQSIRQIVDALDEAERLLSGELQSEVRSVHGRILEDLIDRPEAYVQAAQDTCPLQVVLTKITKVGSYRLRIEALTLQCEKGFMSVAQMKEQREALQNR